MELRSVPALILVAVLVIGGLAAGFIASQFEFERPTPKVSEPKLLDADAIPGWATAPLPDFTQYSVVSDKKDAFFGYLFPRIALANLRIQAARAYLKELRGKAELSDEEQEWLTTRATRLRVKGDKPEDLISGLERRMNIIPPSLVLAQAANESAWGTSRFATQGNNLFGQWCFSPGCGLVPNSRPAGMTHEVEVFDSPYRSIRAYLTNLNRHNAYQQLRERRRALLNDNEFPDGISLAGGLQSYSERGQAYVEEIRSMIRANNLSDYDQRQQELVGAQTPLEKLDAFISDYRERFGN
ncbi:glucosaminidase domain-containing protein [Vreelandella utahensis]|uniref:glucosaminidase domain-containing protein n=1 Tax=Vreelandella halophila TaxID=86177 RepID=UPI000984CD04|nr:glucosaminidase domain-containing protein [Halomonas utahensis]